MARLVASRASNSVELQNGTDYRYWFEITEGGLDDRPSTRGTNLVIPGAPGQAYFAKVEHDFPVTLNGPVGQTASSYLTLMDDLYEVFTIGTRVLLTLHPDARGDGGRVTAGYTATTKVEVLRIVGVSLLELLGFLGGPS